MKIIKAHHLLNSNQYYHTKFNKKRIILHHTGGASARSSIDWWNSKPDHISAPYLIDRDGTILEVFDPNLWAYALGINSSWAEKLSIHIEICNYGRLSYIKGGYYSWSGQEIDKSDVITYKQKHRGFYHYERYTDAQVSSVLYLIHVLNKRFNLNIVGSDVFQFWHYDKGSDKRLISHTTLRRDKSDIHPQPNLIKSIYTYVGCNGPITE